MIAGGKVPATIFKKIKYSNMKKISALAVGLAMFFAATATPNPSNELSKLLIPATAKMVVAEKVSSTVRSAFAQKFKAVSNVSWKAGEELYFVQFLQSNQFFTAVFSTDGEYVALSREISTKDLPLKVANALKENYADHQLSAVATEIVMDGETAYYITAENDRFSKILKCGTEGSLSVFKKTKKKVLVGSIKF